MLNGHPSSREDVVHDGVVYRVVDNAFGQYALWPLDESLPHGWSDCQVSGDKSRCLAYVNEVWTELRRSGERPPVDSQISSTPHGEDVAEDGFVATTSFNG